MGDKSRSRGSGTIRLPFRWLIALLANVFIKAGVDDPLVGADLVLSDENSFRWH